MRSGLIAGVGVVLIAAGALAEGAAKKAPKPPPMKVTRYDAGLDVIVARKAKIERLAEGFTWSEGPLWVKQGGYLLFNDVPENTMYRYVPGATIATVFLKPSGYAGPDNGTLREAGANGLSPDQPGSILLADSGNRLVARMELDSKTKTVLASTYDGRRFNSPNDVARRRDGMIYFTDPPYGLKDINASKVKELSFNGVFRLDTEGEVTLLEDQLSFPNGVELSPDERTLYVSNSDPKRPIWMAYTLNEKGDVVSKREFANASDLISETTPGLPDGMCIAADGTLFTSAPGGVLILTPQGKRLGRIETGSAIANCAFGDDGKSLYLTSDAFLARLKLLIPGVGFP